ncbi:MAG: Gfo/Idh/MocA family oxidoreductase [Verrucomicrobia bacterium]|nr:Gfo/Idh/MocA family oxidoreductase [Verrucomicrobiota bacterium]MBU4247978.1 Gfo/Idh/MocA family oxidoreductase [Verrucomicrobiota bacterium]MBU4291850.1 Gfo/Idh/MocA family oxidoreductase [Verrucomicrobiota bacterium]MBU4497400.1 Gfo/Idh/MocA family oxidoreductase [Verrucomicrobiota bacterium]MCG2681877.1 Gfo/Idh/MocA family oxidoreductase [Kiritimatiellia bacterium]
MAPVKLGIIGCGVIGKQHLAAAVKSPAIELVAVADLREDRAHEAAAKYGIKTVYKEGKTLIRDRNVEAVVLAFPAATRTKLALQAFARGRHVLTEKPVAMNAREVLRMIRARGDRVAACCCSRYQFFPSTAAATEFVASGALGSLRTVHSRVFFAAGPKPQASPPDWRLIKSLNGGGILMNWGCYDLNFLLGITGWALRPRLVLSQTWPIPPQLAGNAAPGSDAETHFTALIRCDDGIVITFERGEYMNIQPEESWQIIGTQGALKLTMVHAPEKKIVFDSATAEKGVQSTTIWEGKEENTLHSGPIIDFAEAIRDHRPPKTGLEQALIVQQVSDAIYVSALKGKAIAIKPGANQRRLQ